MNLPYIQSELFRELVGMETLLKPEYRLRITRWASTQMSVHVIHLGTEEVPIHIEKGFPHLIDYKLRKSGNVTNTINRIWEAIPAECKKENI